MNDYTQLSTKEFLVVRSLKDQMNKHIERGWRIFTNITLPIILISAILIVLPIAGIFIPQFGAIYLIVLLSQVILVAFASVLIGFELWKRIRHG